MRTGSHSLGYIAQKKGNKFCGTVSSCLKREREIASSVFLRNHLMTFLVPFFPNLTYFLSFLSNNCLRLFQCVRCWRSRHERRREKRLDENILNVRLAPCFMTSYSGISLSETMQWFEYPTVMLLQVIDIFRKKCNGMKIKKKNY